MNSSLTQQFESHTTDSTVSDLCAPIEYIIDEGHLFITLIATDGEDTVQMNVAPDSTRDESGSYTTTLIARL